MDDDRINKLCLYSLIYLKFNIPQCKSFWFIYTFNYFKIINIKKK